MILGKNIDLRAIEGEDAAFVLSLRLDPELSRYLASTEDGLEKQKEWIKQSQNDPRQLYFIVQNKRGERVGTIRMHDIENDNFYWGSWIIKPEARKYASFESVVLMYEHAFFNLGLSKAYLHARKQNQKAVNFHLRFGATIFNEDEQNFHFTFSKQNYSIIREKYQFIIDKANIQHEKIG